MICWNVLLHTVTVKGVDAYEGHSTPEASDMAQLRKLVRKVIPGMHQGHVVIKRSSSKRIRKEQHRTAPICPITIRSKLNGFCSLSYNGQIVGKIGIQQVPIT